MAKCSLPSSGLLLPYSPALTPITEKPLIKGIFAGIDGILPEANPTTSNLPFQAIHLIDSSKTSPPTGSYITSAPKLFVISLTWSLKPLSGDKTKSAP